jgi:hypothetical protein
MHSFCSFRAPCFATQRQLFTRVEFSLKARRAGDVSQEDALAAAAAAEAGSSGSGGGGVAQKKDWALVSAVEVTAAVRSGALKPADVESLDKSALRSALIALGVPSAGKLQARAAPCRVRQTPHCAEVAGCTCAPPPADARVARGVRAQDLRDRLRAALLSAPKP